MIHESGDLKSRSWLNQKFRFFYFVYVVFGTSPTNSHLVLSVLYICSVECAHFSDSLNPWPNKTEITWTEPLLSSIFSWCWAVSQLRSSDRGAITAVCTLILRQTVRLQKFLVSMNIRSHSGQHKPDKLVYVIRFDVCIDCMLVICT